MRTRTGYSFKTAYGPLDSVIARLKAIGSTTAPISDRTSTYGFTKFAKLAKAANMRPVFGVELAVTPRLGEKKPALDMWTFFARDHLRPLHELIKTATGNPGKVPSLTYNQALNAPGIFVLAGERLLIDELPPLLPPHFFFALAPSVPRGLLKRVRARGVPLVASSDNYFPCAEDEEVYRITIGGRSGTQTYPRWILSDAEWLGWVKQNFPLEEVEIAEAVLLKDKLLRDCTAQQKTGELLRFRNEKSLLELCEDGARKKGVDVWDDPVYRERLHRELNLIKEKDFEDYFFILADVVDWARSRMLVGPARGSSCGSLVCFLLNITTVDPIPYGLIFERFIDINRNDLPDIDIDFSDKRRHMVFDYAEQKFGRAHVARLGTVGLFAPRSAIKASAAALRVPEWRANKVMDVMVERSSGDSRAMLRLQDTLEGTEAGKSLLQEFPEMVVASRLEGHPNNASQHAAGIILTAEPVIEYVAVDARTNATMCDKKDAEVLNLLKVDALGLTQLSIFERTLELIGVPPPEWENFLLKIPLNDDEAFKVLRDGKFSGVFQFAGVAVRSLTGQCKVDKFDDLVALGALARPGPLATGGATNWLNRRMGRERAEAIHPLLTELTRETYGVVIYQEQVMRVVREVGGLSWEDTSIIRKAMSGRQGDEVFAKHRANFIAGAKRLHNIDGILAEQIWKQVSTMGSWAFNLAHSVAYAFISFWCCWLKAHYSVEFAAATLDMEADQTKQISLLKELQAEGVGYVPFDKDHSTAQWGVKTNEDGTRQLIGPLTIIKGIGPAMVREILDSRMSGKPLRAALAKRLEGATTPIDTLTPIADRVKALHPDLTALGILSPVTQAQKLKQGTGHRDVVIVGVVKTINPRWENEPVRVQQRGYLIKDGREQSVNIFIVDDSDEIFIKIDRHLYPRRMAKDHFELAKTPGVNGDTEEFGKLFLSKARAGKSIFAVKGEVPEDFRMIRVKQMRYLGELT